MDLVFAIGPSRVITHRVPLHGEFSVRLLDLVLVGVPLEPEDVVEVLASAAAPHVSRLLVKRFPPIGRVFLFLLPPFQAEPSGRAGGERVGRADPRGAIRRSPRVEGRPREGRPTVRALGLRNPAPEPFASRPPSQKNPWRSYQSGRGSGPRRRRKSARLSTVGTRAHRTRSARARPRSTFARRCRLPRYPPTGPSRRRWTAATDGPRASATAAGPTASTSRCPSTSSRRTSCRSTTAPRVRCSSEGSAIRRSR